MLIRNRLTISYSLPPLAGMLKKWSLPPAYLPPKLSALVDEMITSSLSDLPLSPNC
jgi:hypothetical protein